ncbi:MAG: carboxypeptidase regulatory-like domain-containing protein [Acidobacteria bacterium]|nr:carboxypeptidase regulatory-like domain-containing protein [Acidobacteriota bacterium]
MVGRVLRSTGLYSHGGGVPGATISVELDGSTQTVYSDTLGNYEFRDLEPGRYRITVSQPGFVGDNDFNNRWSGIMKLDKSKNVYVPDDSPRGTVFIGEKSCAAWDVSMWANGRISGTVRDQAGQPLEGIRVQVFGIIPERKIVDFAPLRIGVTDVEGQYWVDRVPPGPYVVGVNAGLTDDEAYPPTMYPSGTDRERATHVMVQESSETTGIDLVLPPKREAVLIRVRVVNREGLPLRDVRVRLLNRAGEERAYSKPDSDRDGWVTLTGYRGEEYRVRAWHFNLEGTAPVQMEENRTTILVLYPAKN